MITFQTTGASGTVVTMSTVVIQLKEDKFSPFGIVTPRSHHFASRSEKINRIQYALARTHKTSETTSRIDRSVQEYKSAPL